MYTSHSNKIKDTLLKIKFYNIDLSLMELVNIYFVIITIKPHLTKQA